MILYPDINELLTKVDNRYTLVIEVAKRARQITDGSKKMVESDSLKSVTVATEEVHQDKVTYVRTKEGIK